MRCIIRKQLKTHFFTAGLTMEEVIGQAVLFFLVGMDTTATSIAFLIYNLAVHPEIQEKLHDEIVNVAENKVNGIKRIIAETESENLNNWIPLLSFLKESVQTFVKHNYSPYRP